jgi:hypothetical protein
MGDLLALKVGMLFGYFIISIGGAIVPLLAPAWMLDGSTLPVLCALSAGTMLGVALVILFIYHSYALSIADS